MITVIDSCFCGLRMVQRLQQANNGITIQFFADYANNPLGRMTSSELYKVIQGWLSLQDSAYTVFACNTASIALHESNRYIAQQKSIKQVTMVETLERMASAQEKLFNGKKVLIIGTQATIKSKVYEYIIRSAQPQKMTAIPLTQTENQVSNGLFLRCNISKTIKSELGVACDQFWDTVILACTCFTFVASEIKSLLNGKPTLVDPLDFVDIEFGQDNCQVISPLESKKGRVFIYTSGSQTQLELIHEIASLLGIRYIASPTDRI